MSLQNILGYFFQVRQYQKMIRKWLGKGILGIGQRRGLFTPGEILILVYDTRANAAITVQSMRGYSIFVRFKEKLDYSGLSLEELRRLGMEADRRDLGLWRLFFRFKPQKLSRQKGALIQAVEAVTKKMASEVSDVPAIQQFLATMPSETTISERDNAGQF
ncbi:MAG: transcriptional regulator GutM [Treponema sp.]|nr:transcriptional regulator GutM [Treponema sp.]